MLHLYVTDNTEAHEVIPSFRNELAMSGDIPAMAILEARLPLLWPDNAFLSRLAPASKNTMWYLQKGLERFKLQERAAKRLDEARIFGVEWSATVWVDLTFMGVNKKVSASGVELLSELGPVASLGQFRSCLGYPTTRRGQSDCARRDSQMVHGLRRLRRPG